MKNRLLLSFGLAILLLQGCGGSSGDDNYDKKDETATQIQGRKVAPYSDNPLFSKQWYFYKNDEFYANYGVDLEAHIHPPATQKYTGKGIKIAIIDDGLDTAHADLQDAIKATYDMQTKTPDVTPRNNEENHGTAVTGIIGASSNSIGITGIAPAAELYFIRINFEEITGDSEIVDAFYKAKEWGADVINCSWGSGDVSDSIKSAIKDVANSGRDGKGTIIVFASGNDGILMGNDESAIDEVIAVGATDEHNRRTEYTNYGKDLDLLAPGGEDLGLVTLDQMGEKGAEDGDYVPPTSYEMFVGTSASAPIVTGVVALLLEANSNLTRAEVLKILEDSADKVDDEQCNYDQNGFSIYCGYGKIDLERAISAAL